MAAATPGSRHSPTNKGTFRQCEAGRCKRIAVFSGHNAAKQTLRKDPLDKPSGHIHLRAENLAEEVDVDIYKPDGTFDDGALAKLDELFRDPRCGEVRAVRPELYEQLSRIEDHFGGKTVFLVSGFRFKERDSSRHFHASAMDIRIPGVSIYEMYRYAESLDAGGMGLGIYPNSGFIHFDYRAPGEPSYRWTDYSGHGGKKRPLGRTQPARKPTS
ncbi:MAG: YcbK family protein [Acidobacteriota bacterium]